MDNETENAAEQEPGEWAIVEIFGHRRHAGFAREVERFGSRMLRVDVPTEGECEKGFTTHFYGGSAIFSYTLTDEATARRLNRPWSPPATYSLPDPEPPDEPDPALEDADELRW